MEQLIQTADVFIIAAIAGVFGGLTRAIIYSRFTQRYIYLQELKIDGQETGVLKSRGITKIFENVYKICIEMFLGFVVGVIVLLLSRVSSDNEAILVVSFLSGLSAPFVIQKFIENRQTRQSLNAFAETIAKDNDIMQKAIQIVQSNSEDMVNG